MKCSATNRVCGTFFKQMYYQLIELSKNKKLPNRRIRSSNLGLEPPRPSIGTKRPRLQQLLTSSRQFFPSWLFLSQHQHHESRPISRNILSNSAASLELIPDCVPLASLILFWIWVGGIAYVGDDKGRGSRCLPSYGTRLKIRTQSP